ncbi:unnamed protein product [Anisakis simplex]|uniref:Rab3 GTPase-activating protein regulatory subunit (inferred by orthology to a C. elegans protein) n=1 Tax=Anisakis simplex TaxID=6269 RepID=A0A0M3JSF1_ANISI|nr:unnamed protein product [Anisakis simplex]
MSRQLREIGHLTSEQLDTIQSFLLSEASSSIPNSNEASEDDAENENSLTDAERCAGVFEWTDFSVQDTIPNKADFRSSLERRNSMEYKKTAKWLQNALIAIAGNAEFIAVALVQRVIVLERNIADEGDYKIIAQFSAADHFTDISVHIRCICLLPMGCSNRRTETSAYDWVAIAIGLSTGHVRFFTEHGVLLRSEHISYKPIDAIRLGRSIKAGNQELTILADKRITVIEGLSLFVALKASKSQVARGECDLNKIAANVPINFEKLKLDGLHQGTVSDFAVVGPLKPAWFDLYASASVSSAGFKAVCERSALPVYSTYLFAGQDPFVTFGWNQEGGSSANAITDTIYNIGSQIGSTVASSFPSWGIRSYLGIGVSRKDRIPTAPIPANRSSVSLAVRSLLIDGQRDGERIFASSAEFNLFAITDSVARVVLVDASTRRMVRMWKGYRDARCAWIESTSNLHPNDTQRFSDNRNQSATTLFLVIFAPRRGLLEIWSMQNGRRVYAMNVDRRGRLLGVPRLNEQLLGGQSTSSNTSNAFFITPAGIIYSINARFRMALWDESMVTVHDENILREMRQLSAKPDEDEVNAWLKSMRSLKTTIALNGALDLLLLHERRHIEVKQLALMTNAIREFIDSQPKLYVLQKGSTPGRTLLMRIAKILQLFDVFAYLSELNKHSPNRTKCDDFGEEHDDCTELHKRFHLNETDLKLCMKRISDCCLEYRHDETIQEEALNIFDFLAHFIISCQLPTCKTTTDQPEDWYHFMPHLIRITNDIQVQKVTPQLGEFIFSSVLTGRCRMSHFLAHIRILIGISEINLLELFCIYWLNLPQNTPIYYLPRVFFICKQIVALCPDSQIALQMAKQKIIDSTHIAEALSLCLIMRAIAMNDKCGDDLCMDCEECEGDTPENRSEEWDKVELGVEMWDLMLRHLQCMALMQTLPSCQPLSISNLLNGGCAYYREQVAVWAALQKISPEDLYAALDSSQSNPEDVDATTCHDRGKWFATIAELKSLLPMSLKTNLVMCDCAWECMSAWFKEKETNAIVFEVSCHFYYIFKNFSISFFIYVCKPAMDTFSLLSKTGRFPRERLLKKQIGISDNQLVLFISECRRVLTLLCNAVRDLDRYVSCHTSYEDFVAALSQMTPERQSDTNKEPLSDMASRQKAVNYHLVLHHIHLLTVIELQLSVCDEDIRLKLSALFDEIGLKAFFVPFHTHPLIPIADVPATIQHNRQSYLEKCVAKMVENEQMIDSLKQKYQWNLIETLASDWQLDRDALRICEIVKLCSEQRLTDAEKLICVVEERAKLANALFGLAIAYFRTYVQLNPSVLETAQRLSLLTNRLSLCLNSETTNSIDCSTISSSKPTSDLIESLLKQTRILLITSVADSSQVASDQIALVTDMEELLHLAAS